MVTPFKKDFGITGCFPATVMAALQAPLGAEIMALFESSVSALSDPTVGGQSAGLPSRDRFAAASSIATLDGPASSAWQADRSKTQSQEVHPQEIPSQGTELQGIQPQESRIWAASAALTSPPGPGSLGRSSAAGLTAAVALPLVPMAAERPGQQRSLAASAGACPRCGGSGMLRLGDQRYRTCLDCLGRGRR